MLTLSVTIFQDDVFSVGIAELAEPSRKPSSVGVEICEPAVAETTPIRGSLFGCAYAVRLNPISEMPARNKKTVRHTDH